jgi:hypothetical protein
VHLDINDSMEDIIAALGGAERKLVGVVLSEVNPTAAACSGTSNMRERRANPVGRAATAGVPRITLGGLRLAVLDLEQTANFMIEMVFPQRRLNRPLYLTSANGEVLARCSTEPMTDRLFRAADLINADGQPLVTASRFRSKTPLPERVATTDLFHVVARKAQAAGLTFYMLGADEPRTPPRSPAFASNIPISRSSAVATAFCGRGAACQGRRNQRAGAGLSLGRARRSL